MRFRSAGTSNTDSYRAGCEIGEALRDLSPEVILLFASITFDAGSADLFAGVGVAARTCARNALKLPRERHVGRLSWPTAPGGGAGATDTGQPSAAGLLPMAW